MTERELLFTGLQQLSLPCSDAAADALLRFSALLQKKNEVMNLTAVTDPQEIVTRHFLDSLSLAPLLSECERVVDVGTGAGFPGLPLAVLLPEISFCLLDAQQKRVDFLNEVIAALDLPNVKAVHGRAEEFAKDHREGFDAAVSRAVAPLSLLLELCLPLVTVGGRFLAMKAADCQDELHAAEHAIETLGGNGALLLPYTVPETEVRRSVVCVDKTAATPPAYPRRFAKIQKNPL